MEVIIPRGWNYEWLSGSQSVQSLGQVDLGMCHCQLGVWVHVLARHWRGASGCSGWWRCQWGLRFLGSVGVVQHQPLSLFCWTPKSSTVSNINHLFGVPNFEKPPLMKVGLEESNGSCPGVEPCKREDSWPVTWGSQQTLWGIAT